MSNPDPWKAKSHHLVLLALNNGPKHGYEITKYIKQQSNGYFTISHGSLYPVLHSLEKDRLAEGQWQAVGDKKDKKIYQITDKGRAEIGAVKSQLSSFIEAFNQMLKGASRV